MAIRSRWPPAVSAPSLTWRRPGSTTRSRSGTPDASSSSPGQRSCRTWRPFVKALKTIGRVLAVTCGALPLAAVAVSGLSASAAGNAVVAAGYRIVVQNDRDGESRTYSVRQDGSRLAPLFPRGRALEPLAVSRDGSTIAYRKGLSASTPIYASRADGTHLRRLVRDSGYGAQAALSRNGRRLAFTKNGKISIVGS